MVTGRDESIPVVPESQATLFGKLVLDPVQIWIYPLVECVTRKLCQWLQTESHVIPQGGALSLCRSSI
ncbi:hypothetical protein BDV34DRAFT_206643, partial [Aspergillus parasiticus]